MARKFVRNSAASHPPIKSPAGKKIVKLLHKAGFPNHRIASLFDANQGRVTEALGRAK